ncbi:MAG: zinc ribbon domain-containing protein, partial [Candidatus Sericytochromatia bacterium]|nr:zinc ribbon domain-containing protein [Candidatus Tanganyikabacteria bacterium]
ERFGHLFPTEAARREALRTALASAAPRLDLEARDGADMPPADAQSLVIGIPGGPANPHGDFAELLDLLLLCLDDLGLRMPVSISDIAGAGDQILIVRECAGFPLRCAAAIDGLAARYREWVRQPKAEPVHMAKDPGAFETIPGLFPPDEKTKTRALEAFVVGVGWGVFDIENGVVVYRQKLPGMTFLDTRIIGTVDRPLRAVKYLVDHPDLVQFALGRIEDIVADCRRDSALRNDRLARLERYYLRILEQCRRIAEGDEGSLEKAPDDRIRRLPLWDLAETVLTFNAKHGLVADADAEAESGGSVPAGDPLRSSRPLVGPEGSRPTDADAEADADADARAETGHTRAHQVAPASVAAAQTSFEVLAPAVGADSVQCSACQSIWPDSAKYCAECAAPLRRADTCPSCHSSTPPGGKFCPECAAPLKAGWERSRTQS